MKKIAVFAVILMTLLQAKRVNDFAPENLGPNVNSEYEDRSPRISPDGNTLYFARNNHPQNPYFSQVDVTQNIWVSEKNSEGEWGEAQLMTNVLNNGPVSFVTSVQPDGNTLLVGGVFKKGVYEGGAGFSITHRTENGWTPPDQIQVKDYQEMVKGHRHNAQMTNDGHALVMSFSEESERTANYDLYVSFKKKDGTWLRPKNLGEMINTPGFEYSPFMAADGKTLYFASDREGGKGGNDFYVTHRLDETWENWSPPKNMGSYINTLEDETYFCLDASGEFAYIVSDNHSYGKGDIFKVMLKEEDRPGPVVLVKGKVFNASTNEPMKATIAYNDLFGTVELGNAISNPETGEYKIVLPYGKKYGFGANAEGFVASFSNVDLSDVKTYEEKTVNLYLHPLEEGQTIRLNNVFFDTGLFELKPESNNELDKIYNLLIENPSMEIEVAGHTDNRGNPFDNKELSENRASAVRKYLIAKGIASERVTPVGYGHTVPLVPNINEGNRQKNRRVEFTILKK
ncbi:OmpA family protein [Flammeovirgaceae bacterium SG7u.111]|nr:OmpA family protein [Flammeovirgaceae bacterium SG7u.132]WPO35628.1 OmpA family protein [Flammeovirgaceae bacterium SG7u.111]